MLIVKWVFMAIAVIFLIFFAMYNADISVPIKFFKWQTIHDLPLWMVMYLSFIAGLVFWLLVSIFQLVSLKNENRKCRKKIGNLESELNRLRNVSVEDAVIPGSEENQTAMPTE